MNRKIIKGIAIAALVASISLTACGEKQEASSDDGISFEVVSGEMVECSGDIISKNVSVPDGSYTFKNEAIGMSGGTLKVVINTSGSDAVIDVNDSVADDFSLEINEAEKVITLKADSDKTYSGLNCQVTINAVVTAIDVSGALDVVYNVPDNAEKIDVSVSGASDIEIIGSCNEAVYNISGSSDVDGSQLNAKKCTLEASGSSDVSVYASEALVINASGSSTVEYYGEPADKQIETGGASEVVEG